MLRNRPITVYGGKYTDSSGRLEASAAPSMSIPSPVGGRPETLIPARPSGTPVFEAWIEKLDESLGADFGWQRVPQPTPLIPVSIVIRPPVPIEYEDYLVDDTRWWDPVPTKKDRRVVFVEHIDLSR
jgi:hypothetical protein